jgi:hypothetical protein
MSHENLRLAMTLAGMMYLAGCVSSHESGAAKAPLRNVAEGTSISFDEVMMAAPVEGAHQVYQNLHVGLAAVINPRKGGGCDPGHVDWLVHRLQPDLSAATIQVVTEVGTISPRKLGVLRQTIANRAAEVVGETLAPWSHAPDYSVQVSVVSMYFTDSTVGRTAQGEGPSRVVP